MPPSSCFKILKILQAEEFADFDEATKTYSLGCGAIAIARSALDPSRAYSVVGSRLEAAAQRLAIAIGFWRVTPNDRIVLIGFAEGSSQMRIHMSVGQRLPMLMGAVGRAIAAKLDLSREELKKEFDQLRWQSPISFDAYADQVEQAKRAGYGLDEGNFAPGVTTIANVISDDIGAVRYGLSGIMFNGQHDDGTRTRIATELMEIADWAGARLYNRT